MNYFENIEAAVGKTPLVRLNRITANLKIDIYAKLESFNPGGSVKDRIGLAMIKKAEQTGLLKPGGTIVEATAGNTGAGLALSAAIRGYRCIFVLPDKMSNDKVELLKAYGAEVVITPTAVPPDSPESYNGVADKLAGEIPGAFRPNQFGNLANPEAHYLTTGPEIWEDTDGKVDAFVAGIGTGGTISGVGRFLKEQNPKITIVGADPAGSILSGDTPAPFKVEGIGEDFIPYTYDHRVVDEIVRITDQESFTMARRLAREEGLLVGGSSGTAIAAAVKYASRLSEKAVLVALLPDTGRNYLTKFFSDQWMRENNFQIESEFQPQTLLEDLSASPLAYLDPGDRVDKAFEKLEANMLNELPVIDEGKVVGRVNVSGLMQFLQRGLVPLNSQIGEVMGRPAVTLPVEAPVEEAHRVFLAGAQVVVLIHNGHPEALLTPRDMLLQQVRKGNNYEKPPI